MSETPERLWTMGHGRYAYDEPHEREGVQATEYIRADRADLTSVAVAEREPVAWPTERVNIPEPGNHECRIVGFRIREGDEAWGAHGLSEPFFWLERMCQPTSELEAENARLRGERDEYRRKWEQACSMGHLQAEAAEARLAEAMKALEPFAAVADLIDSETEGMSETDELSLHFHDYLLASWPVALFRAARRVREGGKVE